MRMFRIQMSTKALSNVVPGGSAAGSALGYRLLTLSGISGPDAGFALATAGLGSAVVLNLIFWLALVISIPLRGVNPLYATAALAGVVIMLVAAVVVVGLMHGQARAERIAAVGGAAKFRVDATTAPPPCAQVGARLEDLVDDRQLLKRVVLLGDAQLAARRGVAVGVHPGLRRDARRRRAARRVRAGQRVRRDPDHARRARHRRGRSTSRRWSASTSPRVAIARRGLVPHGPVLLADPARRPAVPRCASGRGRIERRERLRPAARHRPRRGRASGDPDRLRAARRDAKRSAPDASRRDGHRRSRRRSPRRRGRRPPTATTGTATRMTPSTNRPPATSPVASGAWTTRR